jgi:hypothetical protein
VKLYHRTTLKAARAIRAHGFRDAEDRYMTTRMHRGVWLSTEPLSFADGIPANWVAVLELELPLEQVAPYEWTEPNGAAGGREFLVPAALANRAGVPLLTIDEL